MQGRGSDAYRKAAESRNRAVTDYRVYVPSIYELGQWILESFIFCLLFDYLFYQRAVFMLAVIPVSLVRIRMRKKEKCEERRKRLHHQFKNALSSLRTSVQAGYSLENALYACIRDLERMYPKENEILREFHFMGSRLAVGKSAADLLADLGERSGISDISQFAAVLEIARRSGADLEEVIRKVSQMLEDKIEVGQEMEAVLAARRGEQKVMSLMPIGIILYLQLTNPGFLKVLYRDTAGAFVMTVCLIVYGAAYLLGEHMMRIEI